MWRIRCQITMLQELCKHKNYVNTTAFTTAGGVPSGDIKLNVGSNLARSLGCNDLTKGKKFTLLLGTNMLSYSFPDSGLPVPVKIKSDGGLPS